MKICPRVIDSPPKKENTGKPKCSFQQVEEWPLCTPTHLNRSFEVMHGQAGAVHLREKMGSVDWGKNPPGTPQLCRYLPWLYDFSCGGTRGIPPKKQRNTTTYRNFTLVVWLFRVVGLLAICDQDVRGTSFNSLGTRRIGTCCQPAWSLGIGP